MNRYSKILHHISPSKKSETQKSSLAKRRTFEEYEEEQKKTETDKLKEEVNELKKNIEFLQNYIIQQHESIFELKDYVKNQYNKKQTLQEGLLNEPPQTKNSDPLTPLDQKFVTFSQLSDHYQVFINRIQQQMSTIGGSGETNLKYLDDIVGIATNASAYNGKFLKYDDSIKKFVFESAGAGSQDLDFTLNLGNTSSLGMNIGVVTATRGIFTSDVSANNSAVQITGIVTSSPLNHGLLEVGDLGFSDTNIIASFSDTVDGYTQLILQNKSSGPLASADIVVNNDRVGGTDNYGSFGINGSNYSPDDAFSDPNGTYLYSNGGSLTVGTFGGYNLNFVANNIKMLYFDSTTAIPYFGTETSTISLLNPFAVFTYNSPQYAQLQIQNKNNTIDSSASVDFIASTDTGTDSSEYIDVGINNSGFATDGLWGPKDGYIYVHGPVSGSGGNLVIGTIDVGDIIFHTLTNNVEDERMRITNTGIGIGTAIPTSKLNIMGGDISVGIDTSSGLILSSPNGTKYRIIVNNSGTLDTVLIP